MNKIRKIFLGGLIFFLSFFLLFIDLIAQTKTPKEIEKELLTIYSKISPFYYRDRDSLAYYSGLFYNKITTYIDKNPTTINYSFKALIDSNYCKITTSPDGLFRIYSWDTWLGGTMHFFKNIFQFKSGNKIHTKTFKLEEGDPDSFYSEIYELFANSKEYYLAINNGMHSTKDVSQSIKIFTIENDSLNDTIKLIKTKTEYLNSIDVYFDFFSVVQRPERPVKLIKYDPLEKIIYIPVVYENGLVTDRFIIYKFTGQYFEYTLTQMNIEKN